MPLSPWFSFCLNWLRFGAAFVVLWGHGQFLMGRGESSFIGSYGHTMVILFFVMSGYIIARTTKDGIPDIQTYLVHRLVRVYIVALPVVLLSFLIFGFYYYFGFDYFLEYENKFNFIHFLKSLFFLNHTWSSGDYLILNDPFWSLCFEFWYYLLFALIFYKNSIFYRLLAIAIFLSMGPSLWVLFPIWLMGVLLVYLKPVNLDKNLLLLGAVVFFCMALAVNGFGVDVYVQSYLSTHFPQIWILGPATKFITDNLVGLAFLISLWFLSSIQVFALRPKFVKIGSVLAGFSFSLYLMHNLIFMIFDTTLGDDRLSQTEYVLATIVVVGLCYLFSRVTEAHTSKFRRFVLGKLASRA